eukprot:c18139_g1_i1.p1 GENE.c18139_g1_i1~~c18139_g1_i1.p1  ORF type:complete len:602 (-),score=178.21 c18139_g1_i1:39-1706(-)
MNVGIGVHLGKSLEQTNIIDYNIETQDVILYGETEDEKHSFKFDTILTSEDENEKIFEKMNFSSLIDSIFQGFNAIIFGFGQTISNKSEILFGNETNNGISLIAINYINKKVKELINQKCVVKMKFYEIWQEKIFDLLNESSNEKVELEINENSSKGIFINNLISIEINENDKLSEKISSANKRRHRAHNSESKVSPFSNAILTIEIEREIEGFFFSNTQIHFIDIAGSESNKLSSQIHFHPTERFSLSFSMKSFINYISNLENDEKFAVTSYHKSVIFRLIKNSLTGTSQISGILSVNNSSECFHENLRNLKWASQYKEALRKTRINHYDERKITINNYKKTISELCSTIQKVQNQLVQLRMEKSGITSLPESSLTSRATHEKQMKIQEEEKKILFENQCMKVFVERNDLRKELNELSKQVKILLNEKASFLKLIKKTSDKSPENLESRVMALNEELSRKTKIGIELSQKLQANERLSQEILSRSSQEANHFAKLINCHQKLEQNIVKLEKHSQRQDETIYNLFSLVQESDLTEILSAESKNYLTRIKHLLPVQ